jgi:hypothetical protein
MTFFIRHASIITKKLDLIRTRLTYLLRLRCALRCSTFLQLLLFDLATRFVLFQDLQPFSFSTVFPGTSSTLHVPSPFSFSRQWCHTIIVIFHSKRIFTSMLWSYTRSLISLLLLFWVPYGFHVNAVIQLLQFFFPKQMFISIFWT